MRQIALKVQAGKVEEFAVNGDYVRVKSAGVPVRIEAESGQVDATIEQGDALNLKPFKRLRVSHSDAAEQTITLMVGNGTSADSAKVGGQVSVAGTAEVQGKTNRVASRQSFAVGVVSVQIAPYPAKPRKGLLIQNIGQTNIWFNVDLAAAVGNSFLLVPGQAFSMDAAGAFEGTFYAISDAAGGSVYVAQITE